MNEETSLMWQIACFCVCGALLGVLYEPLRILRLIIPHHSFIRDSYNGSGGYCLSFLVRRCPVRAFDGNGNRKFPPFVSFSRLRRRGSVFSYCGQAYKDYLFCRDKDRFQGGETDRKKTAAACHKVLCVNCT